MCSAHERTASRRRAQRQDHAMAPSEDDIKTCVEKLRDEDREYPRPRHRSRPSSNLKTEPRTRHPTTPPSDPSPDTHLFVDSSPVWMEATEELIEMTGDKDDETTRLAIAKEDACPWLGKILGTYIELKYGADAPGSPKRDHTTSLDAIDEVNPNDDDDVRSDGGLSMLSADARLEELEQVVINTLQCLINLSRSKKNRKEIADAGCVAPACTLLDLNLRREIHDRSVMLLINCVTGPIQYTGPVHDVVEDAGGVQKLVRMLELGPDHPTAHRAAQVLSLVSVDPEIKDIFREDCEGGFEALRAMLERDKSEGLFLKHAALTANHLCDENGEFISIFLHGQLE